MNKNTWRIAGLALTALAACAPDAGAEPRGGAQTVLRASQQGASEMHDCSCAHSGGACTCAAQACAGYDAGACQGAGGAQACVCEHDHVCMHADHGDGGACGGAGHGGQHSHAGHAHHADIDAGAHPH